MGAAAITRSGQFAIFSLRPVHRSPVAAYRVAWLLAGRDIPDGLFVLHRCDNPFCCNVDHLFVGSRQKNNTDKAIKGRGATGRLPLGVFNNGSRSRPYRTQLTFKGKKLYFGSYEHVDDAALVVARAKAELYSPGLEAIAPV
jgi:hypothetical protein